MLPVWLVEAGWLLASMMLLYGLRRMSSPRNARRGLHIAAIGIGIGILIALLEPDQGGRVIVVLLAIVVGVALGAAQAVRIDLTEVPRAVAFYNGLGGGAAAAMASQSLLHATDGSALGRAVAVFGLLAGAISFAGSMLAWLRLRGVVLRQRRVVHKAQVIYLSIMALLAVLGLLLVAGTEVHPLLLLMFSLLALAFGVVMTLPVARPDMPVLISVYNAMTGLAVGFEGYVLSNPVMMIGGMLVFAAGLLLTRQIGRAANRRLSQVLYSGFGFAGSTIVDAVSNSPSRRVDAHDAAISLAYADRVIVIPGYGMAISQAQHKLRELTQLLEERGVTTLFAIHPVAGRMPGHMNVLLAEAGVPDDRLRALEDINAEINPGDMLLVVGANDIVNPDAAEPGHPLHGLPIFDVSRAGGIVVLDHSEAAGHAGVSNPLFARAGTRLLPGDARASVQVLIQAVKSL